jgi:hypothetical protein
MEDETDTLHALLPVGSGLYRTPYHGKYPFLIYDAADAPVEPKPPRATELDVPEVVDRDVPETGVEMPRPQP